MASKWVTLPNIGNWMVQFWLIVGTDCIVSDPYSGVTDFDGDDGTDSINYRVDDSDSTTTYFEGTFTKNDTVLTQAEFSSMKTQMEKDFDVTLTNQGSGKLRVTPN